jgi:hypothetical protein
LCISSNVVGCLGQQDEGRVAWLVPEGELWQIILFERSEASEAELFASALVCHSAKNTSDSLNEAL